LNHVQPAMDKKKVFLTTVFAALLLASVIATPVHANDRGGRGKRGDGDEIKALKVKIVRIVVLDLDGDGLEDDVRIHGKVALRSDSDGEYRVSLLLKLRYLGQDPDKPKKFSRKDITIAKQIIKIDTEEDEWSTKRFTFEFYDRGGWYKARVRAKCGGRTARSKSIIFDPPGGSRGPMK